MQPNTATTYALNQCLEQIQQTLDVVNECQNRDDIYDNHNIGKHLRHVYDHFIAVMNGSASGDINYNLRNRDSMIERDINASYQQLAALVTWVENLAAPAEEVVQVISEVDCAKEQSQTFTSTLGRELLYLINHTIHHLAFIKLLLSHQNIMLPEAIGLAPSTASYLRTHPLCTQQGG